MKLNEVYNENCLETMKRMPDGYVDLVVTSPPYDDLREYNGYSFDFESIADELIRIIKPGGVIVWVVGDASIDYSESGSSFRQALYFRDNGLNLLDTMIYQKSGSSMPCQVRYLQCFEYMFILCKGKPNTVNFIEDRKNRFIERWGKRTGARNKDGTMGKEKPKPKASKEYGRRTNIWKYVQGGGHGSSDDVAYEHPAIFPEKLVADHIHSWSNEGDIVYDPFGGSGTTGKMSHIYKRKWILSEISEEYCEIIRTRLEKYITQYDIFDQGA